MGAGVFGRNHLRIYRELEEGGFPVRLTAIVDCDRTMAGELTARWRVPVFSSLEECLEARLAGKISIDAASICVPTSAHYAVAEQCLSHGLDLLIEKPLAAKLEEADSLLRQAAQAGRILTAGHLERFNPAVTAAAAILDGPMFFEAHRLSVFTPRALDVDAVLDLMIHDLDIVLSFARSPVSEVRAVGLPILSPQVDIANVRLEFASGAVANFTASRVSTEKIRKLRFFQPHMYVSIDYARQDLLIIDVAPRSAGGNVAPGSTGSGAGSVTLPAQPLNFRKPPVEMGEPLRLELQAFLEAVRARSAPRVTAQEGREALALALEINRQIAAHAKRTGLGRL